MSCLMKTDCLLEKQLQANRGDTGFLIMIIIKK
jgi:hypothetical protein